MSVCLSVCLVCPITLAWWRCIWLQPFWTHSHSAAREAACHQSPYYTCQPLNYQTLEEQILETHHVMRARTGPAIQAGCLVDQRVDLRPPPPVPNPRRVFSKPLWVLYFYSRLCSASWMLEPCMRPPPCWSGPVTSAASEPSTLTCHLKTQWRPWMWPAFTQDAPSHRPTSTGGSCTQLGCSYRMSVQQLATSVHLRLSVAWVAAIGRCWRATL